MRINDLVTRTKYGHDIVFKIIKIEKNIAYLQGEVLRLFADAEISDLRPSNGGDKIYDIPTFDNLKTSGFMNGKILLLVSPVLIRSFCQAKERQGNTKIKIASIINQNR